LDSWKAWFKKDGAECSKVFAGLKRWILCVLDPDEKIPHAFCDEEHEWTQNFDHDDFWLR